MSEYDDFPDLADDDFEFDEARLEAEWVGLNAIREALGIAVKGQPAPTYRGALSLGKELAPAIYDSSVSLIASAQEPPEVRYYRQAAKAESQLQDIERAGLSPTFRFHDLRHTCPTLLLSCNVNPKIVQEMLGHATITQTMDTYSHVLPDMQAEAVAVLERAISGATM